MGIIINLYQKIHPILLQWVLLTYIICHSHFALSLGSLCYIDALKFQFPNWYISLHIFHNKIWIEIIFICRISNIRNFIYEYFICENLVYVHCIWNITYMKISHNDFIHENSIYEIVGSFIYGILQVHIWLIILYMKSSHIWKFIVHIFHIWSNFIYEVVSIPHNDFTYEIFIYEIVMWNFCNWDAPC
jgi:hypothetical protein